jgi:hypothetical protein
MFADVMSSDICTVIILAGLFVQFDKVNERNMIHLKTGSQGLSQIQSNTQKSLTVTAFQDN